MWGLEVKKVERFVMYHNDVMSLNYLNLGVISEHTEMWLIAHNSIN